MIMMIMSDTLISTTTAIILKGKNLTQVLIKLFKVIEKIQDENVSNAKRMSVSWFSKKTWAAEHKITSCCLCSCHLQLVFYSISWRSDDLSWRITKCCTVLVSNFIWSYKRGIFASYVDAGVWTLLWRSEFRLSFTLDFV